MKIGAVADPHRCLVHLGRICWQNLDLAEADAACVVEFHHRRVRAPVQTVL
jgi:hypothetical protein